MVVASGLAADPNFPDSGLSITPSHNSHTYSSNGYKDQQADIEQYGIAGKTWEAAYLLTRYLSRPVDGAVTVYDPPCSLFGSKFEDSCVLELGAGVGVAGIHLAHELAKETSSASTVILTDLENVLPLMQRNVKQAGMQEGDAVSVRVRSLPWGSTSAADAILVELSPRRLKHIVCSDLVYFPELLCPLLRSLIHLTSASPDAEIIIGYKIRSHAKEEPFWKAFGTWYDFSPVLCKSSKDGRASLRRFGSFLCDSGRASVDKDSDTPAEDEMFVFVAHRKHSTLNCKAPEDDDQLLGGWLLNDGVLERGSGAETFELLLMSAIQD